MAEASAPDGSGQPPPREGVGARADAVADRLPARLVLVGFMAAGKTSTGRVLASRTGRRFVDLDEEVERRAGRTIPRIFREEGEAGFRRREAEVTRSLDPAGGAAAGEAGGVERGEAGGVERGEAGGAERGGSGSEAAGVAGLVVATGGGWMARPELRDRWDDAVRIWLRVSAEEALRRIEGDLGSRPMVDPDDPLDSLRRLLERRRDAYALAEHDVRTDGRTPEEVAGRVLRSLRGA